MNRCRAGCISFNQTNRNGDSLCLCDRSAHSVVEKFGHIFADGCLILCNRRDGEGWVVIGQGRCHSLLSNPHTFKVCGTEMPTSRQQSKISWAKESCSARTAVTPSFTSSFNILRKLFGSDSGARRFSYLISVRIHSPCESESCGRLVRACSRRVVLDCRSVRR